MICFHKSQLRNRENIPFQLFLWERRGGQVSKLFINDMIIPTNTKSDHFSMTNVDFSFSLLSVVWNQDVASEHLEKRPFNPLLVLMTILDHSKPNPFSWPSTHPNLLVKFKTPISTATYIV